jgi:hypothetical protein
MHPPDGQNPSKKKTKQNKKQKRSVLARAVPGNYPDRWTDRHVTLIYKIPFESLLLLAKLKKL